MGPTVKYLTTREAAAYLRYRSPSAVRMLKKRGRLQPAGPRGRTDLYLIADLDRFIAQGASARIPAGRTEAPGEAHVSDGQLDERVQEDSPQRDLPNKERLSRSRARDGSENGHAEGSKPRVRRRRSASGASQPDADEGRDPRRRHRHQKASRWGIREALDRVQGADRRPRNR